MQEIPYGYCHCGCGEKTTPRKQSDSKFGLVKGEPARFIQGHHRRLVWVPFNDPLFPEYFMRLVDKTETCWIWLGSKTKGYGQLAPYGQKLMAHQVSYIIDKGEIPEGMLLRHTCDNPPCVRPSHLVLGTNTDNMKDRNDRKRQAAGENHGMAVLTLEQVSTIRVQYKEGGISCFKLALKYGVCASTVKNIISNKSWKEGNPNSLKVLL